MKGFTRVVGAVNPEYREMTSKYGVADGLAALALSVVAILIVAIAAHINGSILSSIALAAIPFLVLRYTNAEIESLGLTRKNLGKSLIVGLCLGIFLFLFLPTFRSWPPNLPHQTITVLSRHLSARMPYLTLPMVLSTIFFNAVLTAFKEEIFFRGYIQTRFHGVVKSSFLAIFLGGVIFALVHMPFRVYFLVYVRYDVSFVAAVGFYMRHYFWWITYLVWIAYHFLFNYLYRKYNSIIAPLVIHFFIDLRGVLGHL